MIQQASFQPGGLPADVNAGPRLRLGEALVEKGLLTAEQLEETLLHQSKRGHKKLLGEVLVELNFVSEEQVMEVLADSYGLPFVTESPDLGLMRRRPYRWSGIRTWLARAWSRRSTRRSTIR